MMTEEENITIDFQKMRSIFNFLKIKRHRTIIRNLNVDENSKFSEPLSWSKIKKKRNFDRKKSSIFVNNAFDYGLIRINKKGSKNRNSGNEYVSTPLGNRFIRFLDEIAQTEEEKEKFIRFLSRKGAIENMIKIYSYSGKHGEILHGSFGYDELLDDVIELSCKQGVITKINSKSRIDRFELTKYGCRMMSALKSNFLEPYLINLTLNLDVFTYLVEYESLEKFFELPPPDEIGENESKILRRGENLGIVCSNMNQSNKWEYSYTELGLAIRKFCMELFWDEIKEKCDLNRATDTFKLLSLNKTIEVMRYLEKHGPVLSYDKLKNACVKGSSFGVVWEEAIELEIIEDPGLFKAMDGSHQFRIYICTDLGEKICKFLLDLRYSKEKQRDIIGIRSIDEFHEIYNSK